VLKGALAGPQDYRGQLSRFHNPSPPGDGAKPGVATFEAGYYSRSRMLAEHAKCWVCRVDEVDNPGRAWPIGEVVLPLQAQPS
jgi:hypothetical protein